MEARTRKLSTETQKMVSLITPQNYFREFDSNIYIQDFIRFLYVQTLQARENLSLANADDLSLVALQAIQGNDSIQFKKAYEYISHRNPRPDSDWIYNDMLLFSLTVGALKFNVDSNWLLEVLSVRQQVANKEKKLTSQTLADMLNGNFENPNSFLPLIVVIQHLLEKPLQNLEKVNLIYSTLVQQNFPAYETVFLNVISLRAIDVIVLSKGLLDWKNYSDSLHFIQVFKRRIRKISIICTAIVILAVVGGTLWHGYLLYWPLKSAQLELLDRNLNILSFFGLVPPIPLVVIFRSYITRFFETILTRLFGYKGTL